MNQLTGTERIERQPTLSCLCFWCGGQLPPTWTTVEGKRVHFGCSREAQAYLENTVELPKDA